MAAELKETVRTYLSKYAKTLDQKLGLTREDLLNDIREQIWKGLLTHNPTTGRANLKTYLNTLIKNRFGVLFKRSKIQKNNMISYYANVYTSGHIEDEHLVTEETGETVFEQRQLIMRDQATLNEADRLVYEDLLIGSTIDEMMTKHKMNRVTVITTINRIATLISAGRKEGEHGQA